MGTTHRESHFKLKLYILTWVYKRNHPLIEITMSADFLNLMVYDYLAQLDPKLAMKFKKETNVTGELPPGTPTVTEIVQFFEETSPGKLNPPVVEKEANKKKKKKSKEEEKSEEVVAQAEEETVPPKKSKKNKKDKENTELAKKPSQAESASVDDSPPKKKSKKSKKN